MKITKGYEIRQISIPMVYFAIEEDDAHVLLSELRKVHRTNLKMDRYSEEVYQLITNLDNVLKKETVK
jgi:hypothetical protein